MFLKESEIKGIVTYTGFHIQLTVLRLKRMVPVYSLRVIIFM
jgi:hypothetical protein